MKKSQLLSSLSLLIVFFTVTFLNSCSKGGNTTPTPPPPPPPPACATITVTPTLTSSSDACSNTGAVTVTAAGSTGFTFNVDNGTFQATGAFANLSPGNHTFGVKDNAGCTQTATLNVTTVAAGAKFTGIKAIIAANCAVSGCHNGAQTPNFTLDCNIVSSATNIKSRSVDQANTPSQMPQPPRAALSQADRDKITAWVAAGGKFTD